MIPLPHNKLHAVTTAMPILEDGKLRHRVCMICLREFSRL